MKGIIHSNLLVNKNFKTYQEAMNWGYWKYGGRIDSWRIVNLPLCFNSLLNKLFVSDKEFEKATKERRLSHSLRASDKKDWKKELRKHLVHDKDHRWYWDYDCCSLLNKIEEFVEKKEGD